MGYTAKVIEEVRSKIAPQDEVLKEARERRDLLREIGERFPGAFDSFVSGSLAHGFANRPISDADAGLKLTAARFRSYSPDYGNDDPTGLVNNLCQFMRPLVRQKYPKARMDRSKRGILAYFGEPLFEQDPTVDLIPTSPRAAGGLWIPNLEKRCWDRSDPELHTQLFTSGADAIRTARARCIRLMKAWNRLFEEPGLCSFNISVLGWEFFEANPGAARSDIASALLAFFDDAAVSLKAGLTQDPAHLAGPIKLKLAKGTVVDRLEKARDSIGAALAVDDDEAAVRRQLGKVFRQLATSDPVFRSRSQWAEALSKGNAGASLTRTGVTLGTAGATIPTTSAFGDSDW